MYDYVPRDTLYYSKISTTFQMVNKIITFAVFLEHISVAGRYAWTCCACSCAEANPETVTKQRDSRTSTCELNQRGPVDMVNAVYMKNKGFRSGSAWWVQAFGETRTNAESRYHGPKRRGQTPRPGRWFHRGQSFVEQNVSDHLLVLAYFTWELLACLE